MGVPQDPQKYEEWRAKISSAHKGKAPWNKGRVTGQTPWNKGIPMSDETKAKVSKSRKGIPRSQEDRDRAAASNRGRKRTPEQRANIARAIKGRKYSAEARENMAAVKRGKKYSEATRQKLSEVRRGREVTEETRRKISKAHTGMKRGEEFSKMRSAMERKRWAAKSEDERRAHLDKLHQGALNITHSSIEEYYAQYLDAQNIKYERQSRIGWYRVDFLIPSENRIVEINGCYWHACEQCEQKGKNMIENYEQKREEDKKRYAYLRNKGYTVDIIWEHDLPRRQY